jgi:hypothetical protein
LSCVCIISIGKEYEYLFYRLPLTDFMITDSESVSLALVSNVSGMTSTCGIQTGWKSEWSSGLYQEGYNHEGQLKYGPLFTIKQMRPKSTWTWRSGSEKQINGDDL